MTRNRTGAMSASTPAMQDPFVARSSVTALTATGLVALALVASGLAGAALVGFAIWFAVGAGAGYSLSGSV